MSQSLNDNTSHRYEPVNNGEQTSKKRSLHDVLASKFFAGTVTELLCGFSLLIKLVFIPLFYFKIVKLDSNDLLIFFPIYYISCAVASKATRVYSQQGYKKKEWVQEQSWKNIFKADCSIGLLIDIAAHIVFPLWKGQLHDQSLAPHAILGSVIVIMDLLALYSFCYCDFFQFIKHHDDSVLCSRYQKTYEPMPLSIVECTPTYITLKNVGHEEIKIDLTLHRTVEKRDQTNLSNFRKETPWSDVKVNFSTDTTIPAGTIFKIVTTEFKETEDESECVFRIDNLRSFGCKKGNFVKTCVEYNGESDFDRVELIEEYAKTKKVRRGIHLNTVPTIERREIRSTEQDDLI